VSFGLAKSGKKGVEGAIKTGGGVDNLDFHAAKGRSTLRVRRVERQVTVSRGRGVADGGALTEDQRTRETPGGARNRVVARHDGNRLRPPTRRVGRLASSSCRVCGGLRRLPDRGVTT